jgi:hypothetical protein
MMEGIINRGQRVQELIDRNSEFARALASPVSGVDQIRQWVDESVRIGPWCVPLVLENPMVHGAILAAVWPVLHRAGVPRNIAVLQPPSGALTAVLLGEASGVASLSLIEAAGVPAADSYGSDAIIHAAWSTRWGIGLGNDVEKNGYEWLRDHRLATSAAASMLAPASTTPTDWKLQPQMAALFACPEGRGLRRHAARRWGSAIDVGTPMSPAWMNWPDEELLSSEGLQWMVGEWVLAAYRKIEEELPVSPLRSAWCHVLSWHERKLPETVWNMILGYSRRGNERVGGVDPRSERALASVLLDVSEKT